jgi:hypothetical protein
VALALSNTTSNGSPNGQGDDRHTALGFHVCDDPCIWILCWQTKPLSHPLVELLLSLMQKFDDNGKFLAVDIRRPAALAAHYEIIAVSVIRDAVFEPHGRALNRPILTRLGAGNKIAVHIIIRLCVSPC